MYGDFLLIERGGEPVQRAKKLSYGETGGRDEKWLRDLLFNHPQTLPISDIDPSFGPLLPLCRELRTEAGPLDLAFINATGRLTLVECKLWRNPEARRKVVAQVLDYARSIARWSYSDLQRQVSAATGKHGNLPFEIVQAAHPEVVENHFIDSVTQTMRSGRFLLLIAGDGIREDVGALSELINRNAALGFSLGLVEVALYDIDDGAVAVQPRVVAKTQLIERSVVLLSGSENGAYLGVADEESAVPITRSPNRVESSKQGEYRRWWQPVIDMPLDDPDQEPPSLFYPNNIRAQLPWPGTWVTAYGDNNKCGVFLSGRNEPLHELWNRLEPELAEILCELPPETQHGAVRSSGQIWIITTRPNSSFSDDDAMREWLGATLNKYINVLRPRVKRLVERG